MISNDEFGVHRESCKATQKIIAERTKRGRDAFLLSAVSLSRRLLW